MVQATPYDTIVEITEDYLGPSAPRFVDRQIAYHLKKDPQKLTRRDLPKLVEWIKVSIGLLAKDRSVVEEFSQRIDSALKR